MQTFLITLTELQGYSHLPLPVLYCTHISASGEASGELLFMAGTVGTVIVAIVVAPGCLHPAHWTVNCEWRDQGLFISVCRAQPCFWLRADRNHSLLNAKEH